VYTLLQTAGLLHFYKHTTRYYVVWLNVVKHMHYLQVVSTTPNVDTIIWYLSTSIFVVPVNHSTVQNCYYQLCVCI